MTVLSESRCVYKVYANLRVGVYMVCEAFHGPSNFQLVLVNISHTRIKIRVSSAGMLVKN